MDKLPQSMCTLCGLQELSLKKIKNELIAYCPNGGSANKNTHTRYVVRVLEEKVKPDPDKMIADKSEVDDLEEV